MSASAYGVAPNGSVSRRRGCRVRSSDHLAQLIERGEQYAHQSGILVDPRVDWWHDARPPKLNLMGLAVLGAFEGDFDRVRNMSIIAQSESGAPWDNLTLHVQDLLGIGRRAICVLYRLHGERGLATACQYLRAEKIDLSQ